MDSRRQSVVALLVVLLLFRWAGEGLEAFAGLSRRLQSIGLLGDVATRSKHTVRHVVQEPPTRMRPPDVEDAVRSKAADWAECMVQFGDGSYDAEEVWVFRRKDFEEFQRLIGLRLSYRKPGHGQEGPARYGEARREEVLLKQRRVQRHGLAPATERNRGIDPKRLLSTMHKVGIGSPDPQLPAPSDSIRANSKDAAMMLLEKRQRSIEKGEAGLRPTMKRRDYRLPLLVKYYKPKGLVTSMRHLNKKKGMEDLRSVVSFAGDEFELDLYHPIGQLAADASGLFLWSRSGLITRQLEDVRRGVVTVMEVEVWGTVNTPVLQEALARGVTLGVTGFEKTYSARVQEAYLVPDSPLQELRSRVIVCCVDGRAKIPAMLERCGYKVAAVKRVQVGGFSLGDMREGQLKAASPQEEAWACQLAGLPASEYPEGFLPEGTPRRQRRRKR